MLSILRIIVCLLSLAVWLQPAGAATIIDTKHNLSVTGPGTIKATTELRVCIFCHTPHNATPKTPLWNREVGAQTYVLYAGTIKATPVQPNGPSRLCLSCHDGTIALGTVLNPGGGISMTTGITAGSPSNIGGGSDLSGDHPVSLSYSDAVSHGAALKSPKPADLRFYNAELVECTTCHDAHKDLYGSLDKSGQLTGKFLLGSNRYSAVCLKCHDGGPAGLKWTGSAHQTSLVDITVRSGGAFPVAPKKWPTYPTVGEWGCEVCHTPHTAAKGTPLLYYLAEVDVCAPCHSGIPAGDPHETASALSTARPARSNIIAQTGKMSAHRMNALGSFGNASAPGLFQDGAASREVSCRDCHNSHAAAGSLTPLQREGRVTGALRAVSGVDRNGVRIAAATYEYEICLKCHSDNAVQYPYIPRVVMNSNKRRQFDTMNPSFHPVQGRGRSLNVPSLPSTLEPTLTTSSIITCTDCHRDDNGSSRGPHGSDFPPILREQYVTADNTQESNENYALCYRCHNRTSILSDASFGRNLLTRKGGHSGHLAAGAPCSICHDPHGVEADNGNSGSHAHLVNFDTRFVTPVGSTPPNNIPRYRENGLHAGSCTLTCHGKVHVNTSYP